MKFWNKVNKRARSVIIATVLIVLLIVSIWCLYKNLKYCNEQYEMIAANIDLDSYFVYMYDIDNTIMLRVRSDKLCLLLQGHSNSAVLARTSRLTCGDCSIWSDIEVTTEWRSKPLKIDSATIRFTTLFD